MQVVREHRDDLVSRVRVLTAVVTGLIVAIATGFWFTQLVQGDYYRELAENNRLRKLPVKAPRGLIFDRKGRLLVENVPSYNLMIDRRRATSLDHSLWFAAGVLGRPVAELQQILHQYRGVPQFKPVLLAENLSLSEVARFGVEGLEYPEFEVEVQHLRLYRNREQPAHRLQQADWQALIDDPNHPLQNRAIQNTYSPGSTFKIVMATAGLTEKIFDTHTPVLCTGAKSFYGRPFRCWKKGGHGTVEAHSAIKLSCDIYFYTLGQQMGIGKIARYARLFGLGSATGLDIGGEKRGNVPVPGWSQE